MYEIYFLLIFFIFGSVMGSFYHLVATRMSLDESIIYPRSHCCKCNKKIHWYDNIPIISYLLLKGKCRYCKEKIPLSYFIVEIVTGILFAVCFHSFKLTTDIIIPLVFVSALIIVIVSDIEYMIILDEVLVFATLLIVILSFFLYGLETTALNIYSGVLAFITMYAIKIIGDRAFGRESLGGGDIKLMFLFGLVLGYAMSICVIFLATFIAFPVAIIILFSDKENIIPFGPFLSMSAILIMVSKFNITDVINLFIK